MKKEDFTSREEHYFEYLSRKKQAMERLKSDEQKEADSNKEETG